MSFLWNLIKNGAVLFKRDPVTGANGFNGLPISTYGKRLAIFGDSRTASAYTNFTPSVASLSGTTLSVTATDIGKRQVGESITVGRGSGIDYIRAVIATADGSNGITATVQFPAVGLPSGSIKGAGTTIVIRDARPIQSASYPTWILALLGQPFEQVDCYSYSGARIEGAIEYQVRDGLQQGFDAAWIHLSANNWLTDGNDESAAVITKKLDRLISMIGGVPVWFFLEPPSTSSGNAKILDINAWARSKSNVRIIDLYTPFDDGTGAPKTNYTLDGLHPAQKGGLNGSLYALPTIGIAKVDRSVNAIDAGGARFPVSNPTLSGTLGANLPTGYTKGVSGSVTESSFSLNAKSDGNGNEFAVVVAATGAGSHYFRNGSTTVVAGGKYRCRAKITVSGGVGVDYAECSLRNQTGDALIAYTLNGSNTSGNGSGDGTYTIWTENDIIIPSGVTAVYLRPRIWFDSAGGASIIYSDFQLERVS